VLVSLAEVWRANGVEPAAVVGHSQGEIAAAAVAGALSLSDAALLVALRSKAIRELSGHGGMMSVALPRAEVEARITEHLSIAAVNGPGSVVVSGTPEALNELLAELTAEDVRAKLIPVDYASHSAQVDAIRDQLRQATAGITPRQGDVPLYSTVTGDVLDTSTMDTEYWFTNLRQTVLFEDATSALLRTGHRLFIEVSPHPVLTMAIGETIDQSDVSAHAIGTVRRDDAGQRRLFTSLAEADVLGTAPDWAGLFEGARRVPLPTYSFQRKRFWVRELPTMDEETRPVARQWFWTAVEQQDTAALAETLGLPDTDALAQVLPALSDWHRDAAGRNAVDQWRYRVRWSALPRTTTQTLSGRWLVAVPEDSQLAEPREWAAGVWTDEHGGRPRGTSRWSPRAGGKTPGTGPLASERSELIQHCVTALRERLADVEVFTVDSALEDRDALADRLREVGPVRGILSLLATEDEPHPIFATMPLGMAGTLSLLHAVVDADLDAPLWCVTTGAMAVTDTERLARPLQAQAWGLGRVAALEHPRHWGGLIDLPETVDNTTAAALAGVLTGTEDQVAVRPAGVFGRRLVRAGTGDTPPPRRWQPSGTVLVTGGTGAIGGHVARWLAEHGAEHLVLVSRHGTHAPGAEELEAELTELGARVTIVSCDLTDREQVATLVSEVDDVRVVVHTAGIGALTRIEHTSVIDFAEQTAAKVTGAAHLDELLDPAKLDAVVYCSSIAGVWGVGRHGAYAAGNAYLDALAQQRRHDGVPVLSMAWGPWGGGGMVPDAEVEPMLRRGVPLITPEPAMLALAQALDFDDTVVAAAEVDWARFVPAFTSMRPSPLLSELPDVARLTEPQPTTDTEPALAEQLRARLAGASEPERRRALLEVIRTNAAAVLGHDGADAITQDRPFRDLGFDSLTAVELRNRLSAATGLTLPATLVFDRPTPLVLAGHLLDRIEPEADGSAALPSSGELDQLDATLTALADDDIAKVRVLLRLESLLAKQRKEDKTDGLLAQLSSASSDELFELVDRDLGVM
jgi:A-type KR domain-containing polyene macrolide polyketide synthase